MLSLQTGLSCVKAEIASSVLREPSFQSHLLKQLFRVTVFCNLTFSPCERVQDLHGYCTLLLHGLSIRLQAYPVKDCVEISEDIVKII